MANTVYEFEPDDLLVSSESPYRGEYAPVTVALVEKIINCTAQHACMHAQQAYSMTLAEKPIVGTSLRPKPKLLIAHLIRSIHTHP